MQIKNLLHSPLNSLLSFDHTQEWITFMFEERETLLLSNLTLIEELLSGRAARLKMYPLYKDGGNQLGDFFPAYRRAQEFSKAQEAIKVHGPHLFFDNWSLWIE